MSFRYYPSIFNEINNKTRGSSSESSSNRDWAEGKSFRQESLSIEIRNGTLETGNWTEVGEEFKEQIWSL